MIRAETWEHAQSGRIVRDQPIFQGAKLNYIASRAGECPSPQAYLNEQNPGFVVQAHFHSEPQFQVFAGGSGRLGAHAVRPFSVHYTAAHTPYGPIAAGPDGLWYFTLRAMANEGAFFMPESRALLRRDMKQVQFVTEAPAIADSAALQARRHAAVEALIDPQTDGVAAWFVRVPPRAEITAPQHAPGGGRFHIVAAGVMRLAGRDYPRLSAAWLSPDERPLPIEAGDEGLEVLVLQFAAPARVTV